MLNEKLEKGLEGLGFPVFETDKSGEASVLLADVVKSRDLRLWHGFPVMLANANEAHHFFFNKFSSELLKKSDLENAKRLVSLSAEVYDKTGYKNTWLKPLRKFYAHAEAKKDLDVEKAGELFGLYFLPETRKVNELLPVKNSNSLEYSLSELFSPRQKELVMKKFKGEKFTKTESEYYSRVVKKRLSALANPDVHDLAKSLLR